MTALAASVVPEPEATTLVVVFPGLAVMPQRMVECVAGFRGDSILVVNSTAREFAGMPLDLRAGLEWQAQRATVRSLYTEMFGNRRGLVLPVDLAVTIVTSAKLAAEQDRILITGCYRGWLPGSIEVLAEALSALHYDVEIDARVPRR